MARSLGWPTFWSLYRPARDKKPERRSAPPPLAPLPPAMRGVAEAYDTLLAARLLRGTLTVPKAYELVQRLGPYRTKLLLHTKLDPLDGLGDDMRRIGEAMMRHVGPVLADVLLPAARDHVLDRLFNPAFANPPEDEALPSVREVVEAMRIVVDTLNGAGRGALATLAAASEREARTIADRLTQAHGAATRDVIDSLASGLLRVEVLTLTLEAMGKTSVLEPTRFQSLRLARFALRRATEALETFVEAPRDLSAFRDSLAVMAAVDALIVIVLRILDAQMEGREEQTPFVEPADQTAMARYLSAAGRMADIALDLAGRAAVTPRLDAVVFEAVVRQIVWLHRFCAYCEHAARPLGLDHLQNRLVSRTTRLAAFAGEALISATMRPAADPAYLAALLARTESILRLLEAMDRPDDHEALAVRVFAVRETLKTVAPAA